MTTFSTFSLILYVFLSLAASLCTLRHFSYKVPLSLLTTIIFCPLFDPLLWTLVSVTHNPNTDVILCLLVDSASYSLGGDGNSRSSMTDRCVMFRLPCSY